MSDHIAFIGAGNMATSLIKGLIDGGRDPSSISASDPLPEALEPHRALGVATTTTNDDAACNADIVVLAVKPQVIGNVLQGLTTLVPEQLVVSLAAGVPVASLNAWTDPLQPIIRCMPNTPALLGAGMTALYANNRTSPDQRDRVGAVLGAVGATLWVDDEAMLDAVTALSGSGPAYFFYLMESMVEAGCAMGLPREMATTLTLQTAYGSALMARREDAQPSTLRASVTSPGGTTERALSILDDADCHGIIRKALLGAAARARELALEFGK